MALRERCRVFTELLQAGRLEGVMCDTERSEQIVKLLDAAVIKMEGGTDFDLTILDQPDQEEGGSRSRNNSESVNNDQSPDEKKRRHENSKDKKPDEPLKLPISAEQKELMKKAQEFSKQQQAKNGDQEEKKPKKKKRHRDKTEYSYESGSESESGTGSESEPEPAPPGLEDERPAPGLESSTDSISVPGVSSSTEEPAAPKPEETKKEEESVENEKDEDTAAQTEGEGETNDSPKPRALHKTCSIFLRNLAPSITKQEVEAMCKRYPGFIRVALQDPQPERNFFRRGWVTFERDVNIKEICWNLNNIRLRDCELGATLNRELKQRVRPISGLTAHKQIVKGDIKIAAKVIHNLDKKWCIWDDPEGEKGDKSKESYSLMSRNPVLKNITDYLVEEGSFEEEELLGQSVEESEKESPGETGIERDENILKALDRMILYLRIVHSIDYYSANEYPNEDEMPHRCGIMHARGPAPLNKLTAAETADWTKSFEEKHKQFAEPQDLLAEAEAAKLGKKDPEAEVEKFVTANTQELAKDKWLCPMSGKKFKGPEFVRKHLFNKHAEKVEEVKKEVTFFNNYLLDPKRPSLPEHPGNKQGTMPSSSGQNQFSSHGPSNFQAPPQQNMMGYGQPRHQMMFGNNQGQQSYGNQSYGARGSNEPYRGDPYRRSPYQNSFIRRRSDPRGIIEYRDLDAPDDADIF